MAAYTKFKAAYTNLDDYAARNMLPLPYGYSPPYRGRYYEWVCWVDSCQNIREAFEGDYDFRGGCICVKIRDSKGKDWKSWNDNQKWIHHVVKHICPDIERKQLCEPGQSIIIARCHFPVGFSVSNYSILAPYDFLKLMPCFVSNQVLIAEGLPSPIQVFVS